MGWHPERVDQEKVSQACETIAIEFAKGTDTPLDDLAATQTGTALKFVLEKLLGTAPHKMGLSADAHGTFDTPKEGKKEQIEEAAKKAGVKLSPTLLALLMQLAGPMIEKILERLKK